MAKDKMRTLEDVMNELPPERRARVEKRAAEIRKSVERCEEHRRVSKPPKVKSGNKKG